MLAERKLPHPSILPGNEGGGGGGVWQILTRVYRLAITPHGLAVYADEVGQAVLRPAIPLCPSSFSRGLLIHGAIPASERRCS